MPENATGRLFQFGVFEANEPTGELRKHGVRIKLHSQPFQVLIFLLERPSEVVTREEMCQRIWGQQTFVDFDHGLNTAINKIREALGDSATSPRYIETVPGKGYRFIAPVARIEPSKISQKTAAVVAEVPDTELRSTLLPSSHELPRAPHHLVRFLLILIEVMYLAFYVGALANLQEIRDIFYESNLLAPAILFFGVVITAAVLIPVRLFLLTAVAFHSPQLPVKFRKFFPVLLPLDLLWALSPFLLVHHISGGLAMGLSAALVYAPFAQRSLILMYARPA